MPIYEFYCADCNTIYSFLSKKIDTTTTPPCPDCGGRKLDRQVSLFSATGGAAEDDGPDDLPLDEARVEQAMNALANEAEHMNKDDPRQAAQLMQKFSEMTGLTLSDNMREAMSRLESGEDPEAVEAEMGHLLDGDELPFILSGGSIAGAKRRPPRRDETLYEM